MAAPLACPECGGERTIRKGVCFRCGYRLPKPVSAAPAPTAVPATPVPKPPSFTPPPARRASEGSLLGKITSLGPPRVETVELKWGDALARIATKSASLVALMIGAIVFFPILIILLLLFPGMRGLALSPAMLLLGRGGQSGRAEREDLEIPATPFTLTTPEGRVVEVVLRGELQGGSPHLGDSVEVLGRPSRDGTLHARTVINAVTGARTTAREHPAIARSRIKAVASLVAIFFFLFILISLFQYLTHLA